MIFRLPLYSFSESFSFLFRCVIIWWWAAYCRAPDNFSFARNSNIYIFRMVRKLRWNLLRGKHSTQESVTCGPLCDKEINFVSSYKRQRRATCVLMSLLRILVCFLYTYKCIVMLISTVCWDMLLLAQFVCCERCAMYVAEKLSLVIFKPEVDDMDK